LFSISALDSFSFEFAVTVWRGRQRSVEHAALVGGDHVLNVNECIISSVCLEKLEGLHDEVTKVKLLALTVVDLVTLVQVLGLEQVHDGEDLTVVRHQGFSNGVTASDELLKNLQASRNDITVAGVQRSLDGDDELGDDGKDLSLTVLEEVEDALDSKESVWVLLLADTFHEDGEVMMVVKLVDFNLPVDLVGGAVLDLDGKISAVVESAELRGRDGSPLAGTGSRGQGCGFGNGLVQGADFASVTLTTLGVVNFGGSDGLLLSSKRHGLEDGTGLLGLVRGGEVTESRVLRSRQKLVVGNLEPLGTSSGKNVLKVILKDHAASEI